jgi:hypothetical protein
LNGATSRRGSCSPFARKKSELWRLYCLSTSYGDRPSEILGIDDEWAAYQLDDAVTYLGRWVEAKLSERHRKSGKPKYTLEYLLRDRGEGKDSSKRRVFRSAVKGRAVKKVRVRPDGTW